MGDGTAIEWTDATWNPVTGCERVSAGCDNCYAIRVGARLQHLPAYAGTVLNGEEGLDWTGQMNLVEEKLDQPIRWKRPRRIFVNSMSDLFHPDVPDAFIERVFSVMTQAHWHTFQVLTKRPQRMAAWASKARLLGPDGFVPLLPNVWLGTSIEANKFGFRADHLRRTPAAVRFLSLEPLLARVQEVDLTGMAWVIVGGESGPRARPMHPGWVRSVRDRCVEQGIPFLFKQWGNWTPRPDLRWNDVARSGDVPEDGWRIKPGFTIVEPEWACGIANPENAVMQWKPKHEAGRTLDGRTWDEYPEEGR